MLNKKSFFTFCLLMSLFLVACGSSATPTPAPTPTPAGDATHGKDLFTGTCTSCHGPDGTGITGLGKDLTTSSFTAGLTDQQYVDFLKVGRSTSDPANTTGVDMPPKGGNPALTDEDLQDIVAYLRTIHK